MPQLWRCTAAAVFSLLTVSAAAQQRVPVGNGGTPVAPTGIVVPALPAGPSPTTAEGQDIQRSSTRG
jgi:hypothetical protein